MASVFFIILQVNKYNYRPMNKIISKTYFSANVVKFEVEAPLIAKSRKAGHFVMVKVGEKGERIPLTIADADVQKGTITLVVQKMGVSSTKLCALNEGDFITDMVGPLGKATHIENFGTVVCAGGGVGTAPMLPIVAALKAAGNRVITIIAARTKDLIILEEQMKVNSDEVIVMTDDGSYGTKGLVTNGVEAVIHREKVDLCVTIGPAIMMKKVSGLLDMAWHGEGTSNYVPRLSTQDHNENFTKFSSFYIEDGSYLRLKNLQLGYTFKKIPGVNKLRLYIAGQNLFTLTGYNGVEPEVSGSVLSFGFGGWTYPVQRIYSVGVNVTF